MVEESIEPFVVEIVVMLAPSEKSLLDSFQQCSIVEEDSVVN